MGRWRPIGLTEGLWREVAAPPPLAFSERSPSPWLRHREDRQWPLPKADIRPSRRSDPKERGAPRRTPFLPPFIRKSELHRTGDEDLRSEEHTSELQSLMRISYAVFCF